MVLSILSIQYVSMKLIIYEKIEISSNCESKVDKNIVCQLYVSPAGEVVDCTVGGSHDHRAALPQLLQCQDGGMDIFIILDGFKVSVFSFSNKCDLISMNFRNISIILFLIFTMIVFFQIQDYVPHICIEHSTNIDW